jgi:hypothetical protein
MEWIDYGKTYEQLQKDLAAVEETTVGIQLDIQKPEWCPTLCSAGLHLVGDLNEPGDVSGEEYAMISSCIIIRYRRLLTKEQLKSDSAEEKS